MGKFVAFLMVCLAAGIWYAMYQTPNTEDPEIDESEKPHDFNLKGNFSKYFEQVFSFFSDKPEDLTPQWKGWKTYSEWETPSELLDKLNELIPKTSEGTFKSDDCRVHVMPMKVGAYGVLWNKGAYYVGVIKYWDDVVLQMWTFGPSANILFKVDPNKGHVLEHWKMERATFIYEGQEDDVMCSWIDMKKDVESLKNYRQYISWWCEKNEEWVARFDLPCMIYSHKDEDIL